MNYQNERGGMQQYTPEGAAHTRPTMSGAQFASGTLANGVAVIVPMAGAPLPATVTVNPAAGDTVSVWYSLDGGARYTLRSAVTIYTEDVLSGGVTHLKFQRTAGAGTTSTYGVV